jgi:uncharacterized protein (DUF433 family)
METNPYQNYDGVEVVPGKVSSAPVLKGTRVAADLLAECLDKGDTVSEIAYNYDLNPPTSFVSSFTGTVTSPLSHRESVLRPKRALDHWPGT